MAERLNSLLPNNINVAPQHQQLNLPKLKKSSLKLPKLKKVNA